jgi:hypothetical protein
VWGMNILITYWALNFQIFYSIKCLHTFNFFMYAKLLILESIYL